MGFTPQLVDLDRDGDLDVVSGSFPGALYFFERKSDGLFANGEQLTDKRGMTINLGAASTVHAVDWDCDQDLDLLVGNINGKVHLLLNESGSKELVFGESVELLSLSDKKLGDSHPVAADWDADGRLDLLVGHSEGGVVWCRNTGPIGDPELSEAVELIPPSPAPWRDDSSRQPGDWGMRAKICVVDWDRDGLLDILLGDYCGRFTAKPEQRPEELAAERVALERLPELRKSWADTFRSYRTMLANSSESTNNGDEVKLQQLRDKLLTLKKEVDRCQQVQHEFEPQQQAHGFVWLFKRKATAE